LHRIKGPDLLLEAFSLLRMEMPEVTLVLAGLDDGEAANIRGLVTKIG
jgi:glycosyltransferase involved in cell wall biosynthesis